MVNRNRPDAKSSHSPDERDNRNTMIRVFGYRLRCLELWDEERGNDAHKGLPMSARFLAWYTFGAFALASLVLMVVSVAPGAEMRFAVLQAVLGTLALCFGVVGVLLTRWPDDHWANRSLSVRCLLSAAALSASLMLVACVG